MNTQLIYSRINSSTIRFKNYYYLDKPKKNNELLTKKDITKKIILNRNNNKPIIINNIEYISVGYASKNINISPSTIRKRLKSKNFKNYNYKNLS